MKYYPHHIRDFNNATRHLSRIERSIYRDLIELYYEAEGQLPLDINSLCRKVCASTDEERTAVQQALNEFFLKTPNGWYHEVCEEELDAYRANNSQKSVAGKASAAARALKKQRALNGESTGVERALNGKPTAIEQTSNGAPTNQELITNNQEPYSATAIAIAQAWHPTEETFRDLKLIHGYAEEWVLEQIPSFVAYWLDRGEARTSWNAIFIQHCENRAKLKMVAK